MTAIELLRTLFDYNEKVNDYQVVVLVYEEYTRAKAKLSAIAAMEEKNERN